MGFCDEVSGKDWKSSSNETGKSMWKLFFKLVLLGWFGLAVAAAQSSLLELFPDRVVARGKGFEVKRSEVDDLFLAFKANRAALGQTVPESMRPAIEEDILERLIATQVFLAKATEADRESAREVADKFITEQKGQSRSEEAYRRQLLALGMTPDEFSRHVMEQAIVKVIIDREIKSKLPITEEEAQRFYEENAARFVEPEMMKVRLILISTRGARGEALTPEQERAKLRLAQQIATRATKGEDFPKLVKEYSEDPLTKDSEGEYMIARARDDPRRALLPEVEAAAFSMQPGQVSDVVTTRAGYHIIQALEKIPARQVEFARLKDAIEAQLMQDAVERELPGFVDKLKREFEVEIVK
jgi:peptidyl-prolyl cis-trans isomerase C